MSSVFPPPVGASPPVPTPVSAPVAAQAPAPAMPETSTFALAAAPGATVSSTALQWLLKAIAYREALTDIETWRLSMPLVPGWVPVLRAVVHETVFAEAVDAAVEVRCD